MPPWNTQRDLGADHLRRRRREGRCSSQVHAQQGQQLQRRQAFKAWCWERLRSLEARLGRRPKEWLRQLDCMEKVGQTRKGSARAMKAGSSFKGAWSSSPAGAGRKNGREVAAKPSQIAAIRNRQAAHAARRQAAVAIARGKPERSGGDPGRNDPCPCESGRKFKQCCRSMS